MSTTFPLVLDLPKRLSLSVEASTLEHGRARYAVRGPRVKGTFIVVPGTPYGGPLAPHTVRVHFGDGPEPVKSYTARPDEPVVNGVRIHGATEAIDPRELHAQPHFLASRAVVLADDFATRRIPVGARALIEAVVTAVVRHWQQRPDRDELIAAAVRHRAADHVAHERREIASLEAELTTVRTERAATRRRSYQLAGLVRRRQPPLKAPHTHPADLPLTAVDGSTLGVVTVREREVSNGLPGRVVYEISGPRIRPGLVTFGPDIYGRSPVPKGFYACWGRPTNSAWFTRERTGMPAINGVVMAGGWSYGSSRGVCTAPTPVRGPGPTAERASAVLRTLAVHFLARPDLTALRIAAGKQHAACSRATVTRELDRLRAQEARLRRRLRTHQAREEHFAALLAPSPAEASARAA